MVAFTPRAVAAALEAVNTADEPALGVRLWAEGGGCGGPTFNLGLEDSIEAGDKVFEFDGLKVVVDAECLAQVEGTSVDFVTDERGAVFVFDHPKGKRGRGGCGCGGHG